MPSIAASQGQTFLRLFAEFQASLRSDKNLPARIHERLARERRFGSRDRRLYRELLYTAIRFLPWLEKRLNAPNDEVLKVIAWLAADLPATRGFRTHFLTGWPTPPNSLAEKGAHLGESLDTLLPDWFRTHCTEALLPAELEALNTRAPLWLRLQCDDSAPVFAEFSSLGWTWRESDFVPGAVQLTTEADVTKTKSFEQGHIEIQDIGSQLLLAAASPAPGGRWLDACAGAGGKTLQLARLLGASGHVDAYDVRAEALSELNERARRARLKNLRTLSSPPVSTTLYDGVLIDAPCSGSGTWRRSPHLKWCTSETDIATAASRQAEILARYSAHVRTGGTLVYATCSLSRVENITVIDHFLANHANFSPVPLAQTFSLAPVNSSQLTVYPSRLDSDGFFVASLRKN